MGTHDLDIRGTKEREDNSYGHVQRHCIGLGHAAGGIAYRPALIHGPMLNTLVRSPLLLTTIALALTNAETLERLRQSWGIRKLVIGATFVSLCLIVGSLAILLDA